MQFQTPPDTGAQVSRQSPMGATAVAGGTTFRTWAPNAHAVSVVAGRRLVERPALTTWQPDPSDALAPLGDGSWGGFRDSVGDGDAYMFFIEGDAGAAWKRDPYARELTLEPAFPDCFCVVRDPNAYPWHDGGWQTPDFSDLIIYQLHVGTFWAQDENGQDVRTTRDGTYLDLILKLDYLRGLGINALQLLPAGFAAGWHLDQCLENQDLVYAGHEGAARIARLADSADARSWYARSRSRLVAALLMTAPGIPALFMGQEFLEDKNWSDDPETGDLIWWDGLTATDPAMRDHLRFYSDLIRLRRSYPALRGDCARVSHASDFERALVLHRWLEGSGQDVIVVASCDELPKHGYAIGVPSEGLWREIFNSDVYDRFPNRNAIGNGGSVSAWREPRDGFAASAALSIPANGVIVLAKD